ncbi:MAG: hypothetical protein J2P24_18080, partial [Streptosporangiales bacterium]|nr:hypothetical protein [Streptosporangiales bacterium]
MTQGTESVGFDRAAATSAWERLVAEYAAGRDSEDLVPYWAELLGAATGADLEQAEEEVRGFAPTPSGPRPEADVVVEVMNGVSDLVVRLCADVVLYGDEADPNALVAEARRLNDRYCDLYDLVVELHPDVPLDEDDADDEDEDESVPAVPAPVATRPVAPAAEGPAPWLHRTGTPVASDALAGLVRRLVTAYSQRAEAVTLEAMWRSAFAAASGCAAAVVQDVCDSARLPAEPLSETRAANEVAAGFEELFAAAVVRLFAPDGTGNGDLADEARRLVQRRDALFGLM